jgi:hypothetical protein
MDGANVVGPIGEVQGFRRIAFDLILLPLDPGMRGKRDTRNVFGLALAGHAVLALELLELAELGRIVITDRKSAGGRFVPLPASWLGAAWVKITSTAPTGVVRAGSGAAGRGGLRAGQDRDRHHALGLTAVAAVSSMRLCRPQERLRDRRPPRRRPWHAHAVIMPSAQLGGPDVM